MASPPVLEIDRLVAPIPGDKPAGVPPSFDLVRQLDESRKEGDPFGPPQKRDWPGIVQLTTDALTTTSKDMLVAARLTEGATYLKGIAGLRDSLTLLTRLLADCWDRIHPFPEDGERLDEVRGGPLLWLNDVTRGARFPYAITTVPIVDWRGDRYSHTDLRGARRAEFDTFMQGLKPQQADAVKKQITDANDDLAATRAELQKLSGVVDERMPELGINLLSGSGTIGGALIDVADTVTDLMNRLGLGKPAEEAGGGSAASDDESGGGTGTPGISKSIGATRTELYRQLDVIADALQRLEPHSPIPFLIKRSVKLGALPFPQLMRAMIQEAGALDQLDRLLGIEHAPPE
jgi:type VI secretion system protein ImpA